MSDEKEYASWYDEVSDRSYKQGLAHGAAKEREAGHWNIPELHPKHNELIMAVAHPYDRKTRKFCKKHGIRYCRIDGIYLDGAITATWYDDDDSERFPDVILVNDRLAVGWDNVVLWLSAELPEWFSLKGEEEE